MQTDVRRSKIQLSKIIKSGGFLGKTLGNMIGNLSKKALLGLAVPLKKDVLPKLAIKTTLSVLNKFEKKKKKKISGHGAEREGKKFSLFISNEHMEDIIDIAALLEKIMFINWWFDWNSKTCNKKSKKVDFLGLWWHLWLLHW